MNLSEISELQSKITSLKEEKNGIILAHNYQVSEIQEIADYLGDSLELCRWAQNIEDAELIVFCGVDFMAEMAAILNPEKKVILPSLSARCPMAAMLPMNVLRAAKKNYVGSPAVLYVNTLAEAKAEADVTCTSSNASEIIGQIEAESILFGPDKNLVYYVSQLNPEKKIVPVPAEGFCYVHKFLGDGEEVPELKKQYPEAELLVHPECNPPLQKIADAVLSTGGIYKHCKQSKGKTFIIGTEAGLIDRMKREIPGKTFLPLKKHVECSAMKRISLENTYEALLYEENVVQVPVKIAEKARVPIERMMKMSK